MKTRDVDTEVEEERRFWSRRRMECEVLYFEWLYQEEGVASPPSDEAL